MVAPVTQYRFGPFELSLKKRQLTREGLKLKVRPQPLQVLQVLLERAGEVVTRQELHSQLWPSETFVDFEHGLNTAIKELRGALNDSASQPTYIETIPKFGYRFAAAVETIDPNRKAEIAEGAAVSSAPVPEISPLGPTPEARSSSWRVVLAVSGALAVVIAAATLVFSSPRPKPRLVRFEGNLITDRAYPWERLLADGSNLYYMTHAGGQFKVMASPLGGGPAQTLATPFQHTRLFDISRDHADFLAGDFVLASVDPMPLWIWPVNGGTPIRVGEVRAEDASWNSTGDQILYTAGPEIRRVNRDGSADALVIRVETGRPRCLRLSPDGTRLSYTVGDPLKSTNTIWEATASGANPRVRVGPSGDSLGAWCGEWTDDGRYFLYTSFRNGVLSLFAIREEHKQWIGGAEGPVELTASNDPVYGLLPIGNGSRGFAFTDSGEFSSSRYDSRAHAFAAFLPGTESLSISFSRDGNWVVYQEALNWTIWRSRPDGSDRKEIVPAPAHSAQPHWSPDGTKIVFEARYPGKPRRSYWVSAAGGAVHEILPAIAGEHSIPSWSPDGKSIAVATNVRIPAGPDVVQGIFIVDAETHEAAKIPGSEGLTEPTWSPDGKYFTAKTPDDTGILLFDPNTHVWREIAHDTSLGGLHWSSDSKYLFVQNVEEPGQPVYRLTAGSFKRERWMDMTSVLNEGTLRCVLQTVAPDGSAIVSLTRSGVRIYALDLDLP